MIPMVWSTSMNNSTSFISIIQTIPFGGRCTGGIKSVAISFTGKSWHCIVPDESGMCFSGSAIVDWNNVSGLFEDGRPGLLAFYTSFLQPSVILDNGESIENPIQQQSLAYSQDGNTWTKYKSGAPIIPARGNPDFRDPKVFWHQESEAWVMVVSCGQHIEFYRSRDLLEWRLVSEFGYRQGAHSKGLGSARISLSCR